MDIKELDKKQLILLTLLITFVVSIATGIVTVSLMNQMPKNVPHAINNVIQRTIEKVTTVEAPAKEETSKNDEKSNSVFGDGDAVVSIYKADENSVASSNNNTTASATSSDQTPTTDSSNSEKKELGQGIIISEVGLVLVDSSILTDSTNYKVVLNKIDFDAVILKKFGNGFTVLKISEKKAITKIPEKTDTTNTIQ